MKFLVELTKNVRNVTELEIYSYICGEKNKLNNERYEICVY